MNDQTSTRTWGERQPPVSPGFDFVPNLHAYVGRTLPGSLRDLCIIPLLASRFTDDHCQTFGCNLIVSTSCHRRLYGQVC